MDDSDLNDCPPIVQRYLTTSHPDLPEDLQFLPPDKHRKVFESYNKTLTIDADRLKDHEDLLVDFLVYMVAPWMLYNRTRPNRTYPKNGKEFFEMMKDVIWANLIGFMQCRHFDLSDDTKERLLHSACREITPYCYDSDHEPSPELKWQMKKERLLALGYVLMQSEEEPPLEQLQALSVS